MSIFDIDEQGRKSLDEQVALNPLDLSKVTTGMFSGFGTGLGTGIMQGGSRSATTVALAGSPIAGARDSYLNSFRTPETQQFAQSLGMKPDTSAPTTAGQDWYFQHVVEDVGQAATDYWAPDPAQIGSAGRIANGLAQIVLPLAATGGNPALLAANEGLETPAALVKQGVDADTAVAFGAVSAGATMLGFKVPASFGTTLLQRLGTGAAANLAVGTATSAAQAGVLRAGGHAKQAEAYSPMNAEARAVDALTGLVFGGIAHMQAPKVTSAQRDAVLTASNAKHVQVDTAPGLPADDVSSGAHQTALAGAIGAVLKGEKVSVADLIDAAEFLPVQRDAVRATDMGPYDLSPAGYGAYRRALESGFNANAKNPNSSATGIDQFTAGTWRRIVAQTKPAWAEGLSDGQLLAARTDPAKSGEMVAALDAQNADALASAGAEATAHNLYAMHHFGPGSGRRFARAGADAPMDQIITAEQLAANPYLKGKTKGEAVANWDSRAKRAGVRADGGVVDANPAGQALRRRLVEQPDQLLRDYSALEDSDGGRVLNTDTARELAPEYLADRTRSADVHEAASDTIKLIYERKLSEPTPEGMDARVLFTAGGTGAGKTTGMKAMGDAIGRPEIVYDTNMNTLSSAVEKIEQALAAGREVDIVYVYRDPVEALTGGAIPRAQRQARQFGTGRTVPLAEHARTHVGVRPTMEAIAARYADDPRVQVTAIDNSGGKNKQKVVDLASIPRVEQNGIHERLQAALEEARTGGLDESLYRGFSGPGRSARAAVEGPGRADPEGSPSAPDQLQAGQRPEEVSEQGDLTLSAAQDSALANPDLLVTLDDGTVVTAADALASADADITQAQADSRGFAAAVACSLRFD